MGRTSVTSTKPKLFQCNSPGCLARHKFFTKSDFARHSGTHLHPHEKPFHCTLCDKHYVQKCGFDRHNLEIHCRLQYPCQFCSKRFQKYDERRAHLKMAHGIMGRGKILGNSENAGNVAPLGASLTSLMLETFSPTPSLSWESDSSSSSGSTLLPWVSVSGAIPNIANPPFMDGLHSSNSNLPKMPNLDGDHLNNLLPSFFSSQTIPVSPQIPGLAFDSVPPRTVVAPHHWRLPSRIFWGAIPSHQPAPPPYNHFLGPPPSQ